MQADDFDRCGEAVGVLALVRLVERGLDLVDRGAFDAMQRALDQARTEGGTVLISMNSLPFRWSISCWTQVAQMPANCRSNTPEIAPRKTPSATAYTGESIGAVVGLAVVVVTGVVVVLAASGDREKEQAGEGGAKREFHRLRI